MKKEAVITNDLEQKKTLATCKGFFDRALFLIGAPVRFSKRHPRIGYLYCALLPAFLLYFCYALVGVFPFGDRAVLVLDLNAQYVFFFEALRDFVWGDTSLLYSFSRSLGGEFMGMYAYYLASPLSYIVALFPRALILDALLFMFLLKCALTGYFASLYLRLSAKLSFKTTILFSTAYALCGYAMAMHHNTMWMDCLMLLPLLSLLIERLITHKRFILFTVCLAYMLLSNYYIGYMVCIYCLIYFFYAYFRRTPEERNPTHDRFHFPRTLTRMGFFSIVAVAIAAIMILPAYYSLSFGKNSFSVPVWDLSVECSLFDLFIKMMFGTYDTVAPAGIAQLYCGVAVLMLLPIYFLTRKIATRRQKICDACIIGVFILSLSIHALDLVWHGFQKPNWLNYRYAFMLVFLMIVIAARAFDRLHEVKTRTVPIVGAVIALLVFLAYSFGGENVDPLLSVAVTLIFLAIYNLLFAFRTMKIWKRAVTACLMSVMIFESFAGGIYYLAKLDEDVVIGGYFDYHNQIELWQGEIDHIKETDKDFYRMERFAYRKRNDSYALGYRGVGGSTSTLNRDTIAFLSSVGVQAQSHWSRYSTSNPVMDSLLGIRYVLKENAHHKIVPTLYEEYHTDGKVTSYKNPYALPIAFVSDSDIEFMTESARVPEDYAAIAALGASAAFGTPFTALSLVSEEIAPDYSGKRSVFERLNNYVSAIAGEDVKLFYPVEATMELENATVGNTQNYKLFKVADKKENAYIHFTVSGAGEDEIYFFMPTGYNHAARLLIDGSKYGGSNNYLGEGNYGTVNLGPFSPDETRKLSVHIKNDENYLYIYKEESNANLIDCFYALDTSEFERVFEKLNKGGYHVISSTEDSFDGTITTDDRNQTVLTTIPYDTGWQVTVDGKPVSTYETVDALLTFRIEKPGFHRVQMTYAPPIYKVATFITLSGLAVLAGAIALHFVCSHRRKKKGEALCYTTSEEN